LAEIFSKTKRQNVNQHLYKISLCTEDQPVQLQAAAVGQGLSCHETDPGASQFQMNCFTAKWYQATPSQDVDGMARHHFPGKDACHQLLEGP
jgi:hypothetical protein